MIKRIKLFLVALTSVVTVFLPTFTTMVLASPNIAEYPISSGGNPYSIAVGSDGALWFTENNSDGTTPGRIGRISLTGSVTEYEISPPAGRSYPAILDGIAAGPDGSIWFTEGPYNVVGRITATGEITQYALPIPQTFPPTVYPYTIAPGPDGALWFTGLGTSGNLIGRITTSGSVTEYPLPSCDGGPSGVTAGPDGALWFTDSCTNSIGRITTSGSITQFSIPTSGSSPFNITAGPDGALWFTELHANNIGRITTTGAISEYPIPSLNAEPWGITAGPDGALWFTESGSAGYSEGGSYSSNGSYPDNIGRITTTGAISEYPIPSINNYATGITAGPDGALWFTEYVGSKIGRLQLQSVPSAPTNLTLNTPSPTNLPPSLSWSATFDAASYNIYRNGTKVDTTSSTNYTDSFAPEGTDSYYVTAVSGGGESSASNTVSELVDRTSPTITYTTAPTPNSNGWNNSSVTVTFSCADNTGGSGLATCSQPVTVSSDGANQQVTGSATDNAGNIASITANVNVDTTAPVISANFSSPANAAGWNNTPITVSYACADATSGVATCSQAQTESTDGTYFLTGTVTDNAGNSSAVNNTVSIDQTAPVVSNVTMATDPLPINQTTTLTANVSDNLSGVSKAEYYTGADPGLGNGTPMVISNGVASGAISSYVTPGMYTYYVRIEDNAGNWSQPMSATLDVYNPAGGYAAGHGSITPGSTSSNPGDVLPIETGNNLKAVFDFTVKYASTSDVTPTGSSTFSWGSTCNNPHNDCFMVTTDTTISPAIGSLSWLVLPGDNTAEFQGTANLSQGGITTSTNNPVRISLIGTSLTSPGHYELQVYDVGANPDVAIPIYQASGDLAGGNVTLHS